MDDPFIARLLSGPNNVKLSAEDLALLEAHLRQPVSFTTIQRERMTLGRSPTQEARNKLKLIRDFNRALRAIGGADEAKATVSTPDAGSKRTNDSEREHKPLILGQIFSGNFAHQIFTHLLMRPVAGSLQPATGTPAVAAAAPTAEQAPASSSQSPDAARSPKRSTERGEGRAKLIAALSKHHQYADGGCLNLEPIGNNELAKAAGVSASTASAFFNDAFQGHTKYKALCRDAGNLAAALRLLNDEFAPYHLLGDSASDLAAPEQGDADSGS